MATTDKNVSFEQKFFELTSKYPYKLEGLFAGIHFLDILLEWFLLVFLFLQRNFIRIIVEISHRSYFSVTSSNEDVVFKPKNCWCSKTISNNLSNFSDMKSIPFILLHSEKIRRWNAFTLQDQKARPLRLDRIKTLPGHIRYAGAFSSVPIFQYLLGTIK